jgi:hypothetical protein
MTRYFIDYDYGETSGVTGWILYKDGIVLSRHGSWEEARDRRNELERPVEA